MTGVVVLPKAGEVIDGYYKLVREIGRGGFGAVFEALDAVDERVAVKILLPEIVDSDGVRGRFEREARLASTLNHPNSIRVLSYGVYGGGPGVWGLPYIAMEFLEGEDLQAYLDRHRNLSVVETTRILIQALGSLAEAHALGIIHRDLKPENLFLCGDQDAVKVLDFGVAKAVSGDWGSETLRKLTAAGLVCGTPEFMSPEQAMGRLDLSPAVDVYAIGCLGFQMLTGDPPYTGRTALDVAQKQIIEPIPRFPAHVEKTFLGPILTRALAKEPSERYPNAGELLAAIEVAVRNSGSLRNVAEKAIAVDPMELEVFDDGPQPVYRGPTVLIDSSPGPPPQPGADQRGTQTSPGFSAAADNAARARRMTLWAIPLALFLFLGFIAVALVIAWPWIAHLVVR